MITFVGAGSRSSGQVRGVQISAAIGGNFFDVNSHSFLGAAGFYPTVIFVRNFHPNIAASLKENGCKVGFDIIDRAVANLHEIQRNDPATTEIDWSSLSNDLIDFYIVTNSMAKSRLGACLDKPVFVIPHHCAPERLEKRSQKDPRVIGYVGLLDQLHFIEELEEHARSLGMDFFAGHPKTLVECVEMLRRIDVGVIFLERNNRTGYVLDYKPNQKLSNFQCLGIPAAACDYESFKEFGMDGYLPSNTLEETKSNLTKICTDEDVRTALSEKGYRAANSMLIHNVALSYKQLAGTVQEK